MRAGQLRQRVSIQVATETRDTHGGFVPQSWTTVETVRASVEPLTGREFIQAQAQDSTITHKVRMRFAGVTSKNRLLFDGRALNVIAVMNKDERNRELEIMCAEVTPEIALNDDGEVMRNDSGAVVYVSA